MEILRNDKQELTSLNQRHVCNKRVGVKFFYATDDAQVVHVFDSLQHFSASVTNIILNII